MKGAQVVLAWDDRRQASRIVSAFFSGRPSSAYPEIHVSSRRWVLGENRWMRTDCVFVCLFVWKGHFCFLSFAFVLHATRRLGAVLDATWDGVHVHEIAANQLTFELISAVLGLSMSIWVCCSLCWRAVRRRGFEGEHRSVVLITGANERKY
jgi:hypothetical protein